MLDVTSSTVEAKLGVDFADIHANSDLYKRNQELITELSKRAPSSRDLYFPTKRNKHLSRADHGVCRKNVFYRVKAGDVSAIPYAFAQNLFSGFMIPIGRKSQSGGGGIIGVHSRRGLYTTS
ncbi:hypothetical protein M8C21_023100 [Ambrosia artemisiifolia]|uniref:Uncharacterized protein n=1 Tax=Ambrosia artemisiifolia TaxID=4212 RepID=A0AAD5BV40_AMBAR|nr:hypothetical protein M8C21_023100 [Ambrosia artemisiifolia]